MNVIASKTNYDAVAISTSYVTCMSIATAGFADLVVYLENISAAALNGVQILVGPTEDKATTDINGAAIGNLTEAAIGMKQITASYGHLKVLCKSATSTQVVPYFTGRM